MSINDLIIGDEARGHAAVHRMLHEDIDSTLVVGMSLAGRIPAMRGASGAAAEAEAPSFGICFVAGTLVHTASGVKPIEAIRPGDLVQALNQSTSVLELKPVVRVFHNRDQYIMQVKVRNAEGTMETLGATPEHPFWVVGKGWVAANELVADDLLHSIDGSIWRVSGVIGESERKDTFNFEVEELHNYFVGQFGVLVHNNSKGANALSNARPGPVFKTNGEAAKAAEELGFRKTNFQSSGQAVFTNGKLYITRDVDGHNGGAWKMGKSPADLSSKKTRLGTYDSNLKRIGD